MKRRVRTRLFMFYGNRKSEEIAFKNELDTLAKKYGDRLQIFYFFSQETTSDNLFHGRLDDRKLKLIINQVLHLDDTDEESTIWDAVDEVLDIEQSQIEPPPEFGTGISTQFILGMARQENGFLIILNAEALFSEDELQKMQEPQGVENVLKD